jgi:subtilisin family serine protease
MVSAIGTEVGHELAAAVALSRRPDVEFAELDLWQYPAYQPDDPFLSLQWHHDVIRSSHAWDMGLGTRSVRIGIVDTPFQMDHPDLAANTTDGWDILLNAPITGATGIAHSTLAAGLAAGIVGNGIGVAGAGNGRLVPINISETDPGRTIISQMHDAVIWAADHGIRVVNMSWTGGDSDTLNAAGVYLKQHARGILVMAAGNSGVPAYTTNQPDIYCVSMTDSADNMRSLSGVQVDFAAPGAGIYSTTTNNGYEYGTGTSYASPLVAGVIAQLFSINPLLGPEEVIDVLKATAVDLGPPGWDAWFGWGRIDFGAAARQAHARLPNIDRFAYAGQGFSVSIQFNPGWAYTLWRSGSGPDGPWDAVQATSSVTGETMILTDPAPAASASFYRVAVAAE